ncbi:hypothetical protein JCM10207_006931 [Rhodosporidiobolus poonsookiae]
MAPRDLARSLQRSLTHLKPPPHRGGKFAVNAIPTHFRSNPPFVQLKDRIPFWNVAPGDRVKLVRGSEDVKGKVGIVDRVDRETNRVFLKEPEFSVKKRQFAEYPGQQLEPDFAGGDAAGTYLSPRSFHISNVRLQVRDGEHEYTATRVRKSKVTWDRRLRRFAWKRYALIPDLAGQTENDAGWRELPWPKEDVAVTAPGPLDATADLTTRTTFLPDLSSLTLSSSAFRTSRNPAAPLSVPASAPAELHVGQLDLGGAYWSRANQTARFNAKKGLEKAYGKEVMRAKTRAEKGARRALEAEVLL